MESKERETEVLIVGGGPIGLFAALCLAERGIDVQVVDKYHRSSAHSYALALHPQTLSLLDDLGLATELMGFGQEVRSVVLRRGDARLARLELSAADGRFPFVLVVAQSILEAALESRLADKGVNVLWNHPALAFDAADGGIRTLISSVREMTLGFPAAQTQRVHVDTFRTKASFLIGADGYDSLTRRLLGLSYVNYGGLSTYGLVEFGTPMERADQVNLVFDDETTDVLWPIAPGRARWSLQLSNPYQACDLPGLRKLIDARSPWFERSLEEVHWLTSVKFERRLAERFGYGRVWLAGDAAHLTSPIGVQNMNVGLREAHDLADRIASILRGSGPMALLDAYDAECRGTWGRLLGTEARLEARRSAPDWARELAPRLLSSMPVSGSDLEPMLEQIGLRLRPRRAGAASA